jgi:hypothetical protein
VKEYYTFLPDLAKQVEIPPNGILSRTFYQDEKVKIIGSRSKLPG